MRNPGVSLALSWAEGALDMLARALRETGAPKDRVDTVRAWRDTIIDWQSEAS
jgi:hypothetical protein